MLGETYLPDEELAADDSAGPWDLLVAPDGVTPVWPLPDRDDRESVERVVGLFGGHMKWVDGTVVYRSLASAETVVAVDPAAEDAGRLYAHLTGRAFATARGPRDAFSSCRPAVAVASTFDPDMVQLASVTMDGEAPTGVLCSSTAEGLRRQVLVRAAAARLCGPVGLRRVDLRPLSWRGTTVGRDHFVFDGASSAEEIRAGLSSGAGLISVFSHSDGVDALAGPVVVCVQQGRVVQSTRGRPPRCELTQHCHRIDMPIGDALQTPALVAPETITARVVLWHTCLGVTTNNWIVDPTWSLGARLLDSPSIGALITTWSIGAMTAQQTDHLSELVVSGKPVGAALLHHTRQWMPTANMRLCLFGDPRVRAIPTIAECEVVTPPASSRAAGVDKASPLVSAAQLLVSAGNNRAVAEALEAYRQTPAGAEVSALHGAVVDEISRSSWNGWLACWTRAARILSREDRQCSRCGGMEDTFIGVLSNGTKRRFSACHGCNTLADRPVGVYADLEVAQGGQARLTRWRPRGVWRGKLTVFTTAPGERISWDWPRTTDGHPASDLQREWPTGPLRILAAFSAGEGPLAITRFLRHRDDNDVLTARVNSTT